MKWRLGITLAVARTAGCGGGGDETDAGGHGAQAAHAGVPSDATIDGGPADDDASIEVDSGRDGGPIDGGEGDAGSLDAGPATARVGSTLHRAEDPYLTRSTADGTPEWITRGRTPGPLSETWFDYANGVAVLAPETAPARSSISLRASAAWASARSTPSSRREQRRRRSRSGRVRRVTGQLCSRAMIWVDHLNAPRSRRVFRVIEVPR